MKRQKILVTGCLGFIGTILCRRLLDEGYIVYGVNDVTNDNFNKLKCKSFHFICSDLTCNEVKNIMPKIHIVFHLAAQTSKFYSENHPLEDFTLNATKTIELLELVRKYDKRMIMPSSIGLYEGSSSTNPLTEDQISPKTFYSISKRVAEKYCMAYYKKFNIKVAVFRLSYAYGKTNYRGVVNDIISGLTSIETKIKLFMNPNNILDMIHVDDIIGAFILALDNDEIYGKVINLSYGSGISIKEIIKILSEITGKVPKTILDKNINKEPVTILMDNSKIQKILNWKPQIDIRQGMESLAM
jgi:nucleoside-diphosphate-sugar epimerase